MFRSSRFSLTFAFLFAISYLGLPLVNIPEVYNTKLKVDICYFKNTLISSHGLSPKELRDVWNQIKTTNCTVPSGQTKDSTQQKKIKN